MINSGPDNSS